MRSLDRSGLFCAKYKDGYMQHCNEQKQADQNSKVVTTLYGLKRSSVYLNMFVNL